MKKMLVFVLVLGMASLANAGVIGTNIVTDNTGYDGTTGSGTADIVIAARHLQGITCTLSVLPGDTGTVGAAGGFGQFTMFGGGVTPMELPAMGQSASTATSTKWTGAGMTGFGYMSPVMDIISNVALTNTGASTTFVLTTGVNATVTNDGTWTAPGNQFENGVTVDFGGGVVINNVLDHFTVVPEPMTMSLLGIGGLALLRRKRA